MNSFTKYALIAIGVLFGIAVVIRFGFNAVINLIFGGGRRKKPRK